MLAGFHLLQPDKYHLALISPIEEEAMSSRNVREVLWVAITTLVTNGGTLQERLVSAALGLGTLSPQNDLPKQDQDALDFILHELTKEPAVGGEGRIIATARKMSDAAAEQIAKEILSLYANLRGGI